MPSKLLLILVVLVIIIGGAVFVFRNSSTLQQTQTTKPVIVNSVAKESISLADSEEIINKINSSREALGLLEINFDNNLCAYAKRVSLIEVANDARPGDPPVKNDVESTEVQKTYFAPYSSSLLNLAFYKGNDLSLKAVISDFSSKNSSAMAVDTAGGCVSGIYSKNDGGWVINFVGGGK